jgi:hypothetical protein
VLSHSALVAFIAWLAVGAMSVLAGMCALKIAAWRLRGSRGNERDRAAVPTNASVGLVKESSGSAFRDWSAPSRS